MNCPNEMASSEDFEFEALNEARNYREALIRHFSPWLKGRVLEVGAGIGQITRHLLQRPEIRQLTSIEPDARFCTQIRAALPDHQIIQGTIESVPAGLEWDAILSINVLEHIEDDDGELSRYCGILSPANGALCLFVPARQEIYAPIDRDFGHFRRYKRPDLVGKVVRAGFKIEMAHYFNCAGYFAWWLSFCVLRKRSFDVKSVRAFDRHIFPVVRALEWNLVHPPIGQSLIVVGRARGESPPER